MKTPACPKCGSQGNRNFNPKGLLCLNVGGCEQRRCQRRQDEDKKLWKDKRWVQCHGTSGGRTVIFCTLGEGHAGLHLQGTREWGGNYEAPIAQALRARS